MDNKKRCDKYGHIIPEPVYPVDHEGKPTEKLDCGCGARIHICFRCYSKFKTHNGIPCK